jgi:DNA repair protein RecO (recombination protein O)
MADRSQRIQLEPAYVLHHRDYRDTSKILDVFTRDHGRITLFARAVRGKGGMASLLQPFQPLLISWSSKSDAGQLNHAELVGEPGPLPSPRLMSGFYLNELLIKLLHQHDVHADVFELYGHALLKLKHDADEPAALRSFEKRLLDLLGFGMTLDHEGEGGVPIQAHRNYRYVHELGPVPLDAQANAAKGVYRGSTLLALARGDFTDPADKADARHLLRAVLDRVLEGRALQSREILTDMRRLTIPSL